ncbi:hypothetical protein COB55_02635 [Candidatus Wolfebacteria bacterium]|nr:MAG: hypothetical protein COB55_02635 [Candidatus Wolfebacteria bacterium]
MKKSISFLTLIGAIVFAPAIQTSAEDTFFFGKNHRLLTEGETPDDWVTVTPGENGVVLFKIEGTTNLDLMNTDFILIRLSPSDDALNESAREIFNGTTPFRELALVTEGGTESVKRQSFSAEIFIKDWNPKDLESDTEDLYEEKVSLGIPFTFSSKEEDGEGTPTQYITLKADIALDALAGLYQIRGISSGEYAIAQYIFIAPKYSKGVTEAYRGHKKLVATMESSRKRLNIIRNLNKEFKVLLEGVNTENTED